MIATVLGGIGLFLLGMILMTEALRSLAGNALRRILSRFTGGTFRAIASGAVVAAVVQSSSATTVMTIGFVSAGLLTFKQALGVILGSNIGTTSTGWLVSLLGLKFSLGTVALPLVGIGALMKLLGKERVAASGLALAGFGLVFIGIATLQTGMKDLALQIDLSGISGESFGGRLMLVITGIVMTVVMQSSSAAVATTLTALYSGVIVIEQAALLVVGQNVGTTVKAALVCIGASAPARRAAVGHILFNVTTAAIALCFLRQFTMAAFWFADLAGDTSPAIQIAAFHTLFNMLGVILFLPFLGLFAKLITRLVPQKGSKLTVHLDPSVARLPSVAVETAQRAIREILVEVIRVAVARIQNRKADGENASIMNEAAAAADEVRSFLGMFRSNPESAGEHDRHLSALHALDHLERLIAAVKREKSAAFRQSGQLEPAALLMCEELEKLERLLPEGRALEGAEELARTTAEHRRKHRQVTLEQTAEGKLTPFQSGQLLEAMRWLDRLTYHVWRIVVHLQEKGEPQAMVESASDSEA